MDRYGDCFVIGVKILHDQEKRIQIVRTQFSGGTRVRSLHFHLCNGVLERQITLSWVLPLRKTSSVNDPVQTTRVGDLQVVLGKPGVLGRGQGEIRHGTTDEGSYGSWGWKGCESRDMGRS